MRFAADIEPHDFSGTRLVEVLVRRDGEWFCRVGRDWPDTEQFQSLLKDAEFIADACNAVAIEAVTVKEAGE